MCSLVFCPVVVHHRRHGARSYATGPPLEAGDFVCPGAGVSVCGSDADRTTGAAWAGARDLGETGGFVASQGLQMAGSLQPDGGFEPLRGCPRSRHCLGGQSRSRGRLGGTNAGDSGTHLHAAIHPVELNSNFLGQFIPLPYRNYVIMLWPVLMLTLREVTATALADK